MLITAILLTLTSHAAPTGLTDSQINNVLETINEGEIAAARIAMSHARGEEAKNFAKMMRNEHLKNLQQARDLARKDKLADDKSDLSETLKADASQANDQLKKSGKKTFDLAYLNEQVDMHQKALDTIRNTLMPAAKGGDLKHLLDDTRKHVESHLAMARNASANLGAITPSTK